eukprot:m.37358 g.37358  ORF g.37358 m.37358 type:complete len:287 (-) comp11374_c0_seq4:81-941(-)
MLNNLPSSTALFAVVCMSFLLMFYQSLLRTQDGRSSKDEFKVSWAQPSASSPDTKLPRYGLMRMEWQTPIYRVNARSFNSRIDGNALAAIADAISSTYTSFVNANQAKLVENSWDPNGINQVFFRWQRDGGWDRRFRDHPAFLPLPQLFHFVTDTYLHAIGMDQDQIKTRDHTIHAWATMNKDCIGHPQHTHPNNMISGVFYVKVPDCAGPIVFSDPRGPYPGLDGTIVVHPQEGDIIIFPSWLPHEVMATACKDSRISIAFNMPGDWADTASVSVQFPLDFDSSP